MLLGEWTTKQAYAYLKYLGVKEKYAKSKIVKKAIEFRKNKTHTNIAMGDLKFPSLWTSGLDLTQCIDTPMHQIFMGMIKNLIELVADWLKSQNKFLPFVKAVNPLIVTLTQLRLSWCNVEMLTGTKFGTGGWVAETYLGYARLLPIIYWSISSICDSQSIDIHPL